MKKINFVLSICVLFTLSACSGDKKMSATSGSKTKPMTGAVNIPKISVGSTYNFLGTPIHIGDGEGSTEDIRSNYSKYWKNNPPKQASWQFEIEGSPASVRLLINVYSTVVKGRNDCPTVLELNGQKILDFREIPDVGSWKTVKANIVVQPGQLENGQNKITVREVQCSGMLEWNDSVITSVKLSVN